MTDTDRRTEPALTAEEWAGIHALDERLLFADKAHTVYFGEQSFYGHDVRENLRVEDRPHAAAALCLYGQPFGFSWDDIDTLARHLDLSDDQYADPALMSLVSRIKALLPPRSP